MSYPKLSVFTLLIALVSTTGCVSQNSTQSSRSNFDEVTLQPGASQFCLQSPCAVYFLMPEGEGDYVVSGNNVFPEKYPAGKKVFLGSYWTGIYSFKVEGTDAPLAHLSVTGLEVAGE